MSPFFATHDPSFAGGSAPFDDTRMTALRPAGMPKRTNELVPPASSTRCGEPDSSERVAMGYPPSAAPPEKRRPGKMLRKFHDGMM